MDLTSRQLLLAFVPITFALGYFAEWFLLRTVGTTYSLPYLLLMFIPAATAAGLSWYSGHMFDDFGFFVPADTHWLMAYLIPAAAAIFTLGLTVALGAGHFVYPGASALTRTLIFTSTIGVGLSLVSAVGFELGWRGFMLSHAERAGIPMPGLLIGLCASAWQWPLVAFGDLGNPDAPALSLALFTVAGCASSVVFTWLRARSQSIGPVVLAHAVHVTWVHEVIPQFVQTARPSGLLMGEAGLGLAVAYALVAAVCLMAD